MSLSTPFIVVVAALLLSALSYCSADNVYCVTPTLPANTSCSSCPRNSTHNSTHCATLSEYVQETELYFISNTTMVFLPGDHTLDVNVTVANVSRLTMCGESSLARVVCNGSVGFSFSNIVDLKTRSLTFTSCGRNFGSSKLKVTLFLESVDNAELVNCSFHDNFGTALMIYDTKIILAEKSEFTHNHCSHKRFIHNSACIGGGGITAVHSNLMFIGNTTFIGNHGSVGIKVTNCSLSSVGSIHFINNSNTYDSDHPAVAVWASASSLKFVGTSNFINNSVKTSEHPRWCSAVYTCHNTSLSFNGTNNFVSNWANTGSHTCGAIFAVNSISVNFTGISHFINNLGNVIGIGAITVISTPLSFTGTSNFNNSASYYGGAIYVYSGSLSLRGTSNFINNSASASGGAIYAQSASLSLRGTSNFINNVCGRAGGAIAAFSTSLSFMGTINFTNNSAQNGGGVSLGGSSLSILPNTTVYWENNHAHLGGAIYVDDRLSNPFIYCHSTEVEIKKDKCFLQLPGQNLSNGIDAQFVFKGNSATAGSLLYGGAIDNCKLTGLETYSSGEVFDMLFHTENDSINSTISSDPIIVCSCEGNNPDCGDMYRTVYPGETIHVSLITLGQREGIVHMNTTVASSLENGQGHLQGFQYTQMTNGTCIKLNYTVFSLTEYEDISLELYAGGPCTTFSEKLSLILDINTTCPPGFKLSVTKQSCVCEHRLAQYTSHCNITDGLGKITRDSQNHFWVGYDQQSQGLILHPHCRFDYCVSSPVEFSLNETDLQCGPHRSDLLCGACKKGYSLTLGTSQCKQCTNNHLALLVPFALMGITLVFLLLVCKLTVATGTLSGIVFYANIVGVNRALFLPSETTDTLSAFIAWLNLDFGVESCFYNGMDAYSKTWLQFVFPVYIWLIVGLLIVVSRFSDKFAKLLGNNPVSVLATLIFLSYAKILRTIIAAINVTYLEYPMYNKAVWLYDANVDYLGGKHIPLFLVAMFFFLFLFLPYTLLLLFGQWLQAMSHLKLFAWVNRLKPFMDSYHAPYKAKHRYWPGLLLVFRFSLFLTFALNLYQVSSINLLAILVGTGILTVWAWISGGVYKNWCLNALEALSALNLIILSAVTYHVQLTREKELQQKQLAVGHTSVIIALVTFIGIFSYHIFQQVRATKLCKKIPMMNQRFHSLNVNHAVIKNAEEVEDSNQLRETLLEDSA